MPGLVRPRPIQIARALALATLLAVLDTAPALSAPTPFSQISPADDSWVSSTVPTLTWNATTSSAGMARYDVIVDGVVVTTVPASACAATCSYAVASLSNGTHHWSITAIDDNGDQGDSGERTFGVDTVPPNRPVFLAGGPYVSTSSVEWLAPTDLPFPPLGTLKNRVVLFEVSRNGVVLGTTTGTSYSVAPQPAGDVTWSIVAIDEAGNRSAPTIARWLEPLHLILTAPKYAFAGQPVTISTSLPSGFSAEGARLGLDRTRPDQHTDAVLAFGSLTTTHTFGGGIEGWQLSGWLADGRYVSTPPITITPRKPSGTSRLKIDAGARFARRRSVKLTLGYPTDAAAAAISINGAKAIPIGLKAATSLKLPKTVKEGPVKLAVTYTCWQRTTKATATIRLDTTRPRLRSAVLQHGTLHVAATDAVSGLASIQLARSSRSHPAKARPFTAALKATTATWVRVIDRAGNASAWTRISHR
jgi:hypothetical protein